MQTFLAKNLLNYEHEHAAAGSFLVSSSLSSWQTAAVPLLSRATTLPSCGKCSTWQSHCETLTSHFSLPPIKLQQTAQVQSSSLESRLCLLLLTNSPMLVTELFFRRKSRFCSAWECLRSGRWTTCCLRSHLTHHTTLQNQPYIFLENNLSINW